MSYGGNDDWQEERGGNSDPGPDLPPKAMIGAFIGAAIGMAIWAAGIIHFDIEIGWLAWVIGGLIAYGARLGGTLGGRNAGIFCAVLAVVAIAGGKVVAVKAIVPKMARESFSQQLDLAAHSRMMAQAQEYAEISKKNDTPALRKFLFGNDHSSADAAELVSNAEIEAFAKDQGAVLKSYAARRPAHASWQTEEMERIEPQIQAITSSITIKDALSATTGIMDILFILLGVATAYKWGGRMED